MIPFIIMLHQCWHNWGADIGRISVVQFEDGKMAAIDGSDDNAIMVARLQHERAGRMELLKQLDTLRAHKVRGTHK